MSWFGAARVTDLPAGRGWPIRVAGQSIVLFAAGGTVHAVDNRCLHAGSPIDDGALADGCVVCPWHGWTYDVATGELLVVDGRRPGLRTYPTRVEGDRVWVEVADG